MYGQKAYNIDSGGKSNYGYDATAKPYELVTNDNDWDASNRYKTRRTRINGCS